jgi:acetyl-CoA carboxylase biotin carboxyl carrier protein
MELEQIKELIARLEEGKIKKFFLKKGDFEIHLEKEGDPAVKAIAATPYLPPSFAPAALRPSQPVVAQEAKQEQEIPVGKLVTSPMVGTFYSAPAPGQPVFVKIGDRVEESTVVCVIEAMKVMNEVKAGVSGTVAAIFIDNAQPVEFGTKLFSIV